MSVKNLLYSSGCHFKIEIFLIFITSNDSIKESVLLTTCSLISCKQNITNYRDLTLFFALKHVGTSVLFQLIEHGGIKSCGSNSSGQPISLWFGASKL